jgi:plasmid maintenance system antidote protein VapI
MDRCCAESHYIRFRYGDWGVTLRIITKQVLDEVQRRYEIPSDYKLAKTLGVTKQAISNYRNDNTSMNDDVAIRASQLLGRHPAPLLAQLAAERAKTPEEVRVWTEAAEILKKATSDNAPFKPQPRAKTPRGDASK